MFTCQKCGVLTKKLEKENKLVTKTRTKKYKYLKIGNRNFDITHKSNDQIQELKSRFHRMKSKLIETQGWEIVQEIGVCTDCYKREVQNDK